MDILDCRAGTSAVELVTNSWKSASRFSETRKALELIERYDQPVYRSGFNFEKSSTYNRAAFEEYKVTLRAEMEKPHVVDPKLKDYADLNYKPNASIGSGSTTVGIRHELTTGEKVHNKLHSQKGREMIKVLEKWLIQMHDREIELLESLIDKFYLGLFFN
ncbi:hypothetical protein [Simkania negevensis]|nr:hypothetical protein [Simkania negevensis]